MDSFDYILVALGIVLIAIGLFLFIAGKRDSSIANQVEGFGIKLNVSNPSIILIVLGIGLVLVPRLLPQNSPASTQQKIQQNPPVVDNPIGGSGGNTVKTGDINNNQSQSDNVFFPDGNWVLTQYQENGVDLTLAISGSIRFTKTQANQRAWNAQFNILDDWGNAYNYVYQGQINAVQGGYSLSINQSNDPNFVQQGPVNLILKMDNAASLHMEYFYAGSAIILHFTQA